MQCNCECGKDLQLNYILYNPPEMELHYKQCKKCKKFRTHIARMNTFYHPKGIPIYHKNDLKYIQEHLEKDPNPVLSRFETKEPYKPDTNDSIWYLIAVTIGTIFAVIMVLIIFGCSNPVNNDNRDGLIVQRPCSDCHIVVDGEIQKRKIKPIGKYGYETLTCDTIEGK